jgi:putative tryptophan/tyrosine transport system substrate-binding protein
MLRREFLGVLGGAAAAWPLAARAQQTGQKKIPRVGVLWHAGNAEEEGIYFESVRQGLRDHGYVIGQTIIVEDRFPNEERERFFSLAIELAELNMDVLVGAGRLASIALQQAAMTRNIPVVFINDPNPVESKLVASLANPGSNVTGISNLALGLIAKRVELLKEIVPNISQVALLVNANDAVAARHYAEEAQVAAQRLKLTFRVAEVRSPNDLVSAFSKMSNDKVDGLVVSQDGLFYATRKQIADLALAHRLPTMVYSRETVMVGALVSYGPSNPLNFRRAGIYVDKILKGAKPADLPVEQPTKFEFIINLKIATALGLDVPMLLQLRADELIE